MVLNNQVVINIPAGIYDFCLVNPTPNDKLWIATGDNGRKTDYEFESGKTYHFFVEFAAGNDMTTITVSDSYTGEVLDVVKSANQTIDENSRQGEGNFSSDSQSNYTPTRVLTGFNVYKNGTMIDQIADPDILTYVDNNVADGTHNYCIEAVYDEGVAQQVCRDVTVGEPVCEPATDVQAIADGSTVNVTWTAPASTKAGEIQFFDDFETGQIIKWTQIDADGDGHIWFASGAAGYNSVYSAQSRSWIGGDGALTPDNYLITPIIDNATKVQYWVCVQSSWYPSEHYAVMASSTGTNADDFTVVFEETMTAKEDAAAQESENREDNNKFGTWYERSIDLPEGTKYVAFRHYNCTDQLGLNLDNVAVFGGIPVPDYTYTITRNGTEIANGLTETSYTDNNVSDGSYEYCVEVVYPNCTSDAACAEPIVINSIDSEFAETFKVYPNPAKDIINVEGDVANIVMYNSVGQAVRTNLNDGQIDVSSLENGIYYLVIKGSDRTQRVEKVIIAK